MQLIAFGVIDVLVLAELTEDLRKGSGMQRPDLADVQITLGLLTCEHGDFFVCDDEVR